MLAMEFSICIILLCDGHVHVQLVCGTLALSTCELRPVAKFKTCTHIRAFRLVYTYMNLFHKFMTMSL